MARLEFILIYILLSSNLYSQWITQTSGTPRHLYDVELISADTIFCIGELGTIIKTINGGASWTAQISAITGDLTDISFINNTTGLSVGGGGRVMKTTDGGAVWVFISNPTSGLGGGVQFVTTNTAYAVGDQIIKSMDSGLSWSVIQDYPNLMNSLYFTDSLTGTVVGTGGFIVTTTNGGINWTQRYMMLPVQLADSALGCIYYVNSLTGFVGGNFGIVVKTINGGANWTYVPLGNNFAAQGIFFTDVNTGYVASQAGRIYRTTNSGLNWVQQTTGVTDPLTDVEFIDSNTGWVCGLNGRILKTTNGGVTWIQPISNEIPKSFSLEQNYPNPFNPVTKIRFNIKDLSDSKLTVYDILGKEAVTLVNEKLKPGIYETEFDGTGYPSGEYFYRLTTDNFTETKKMVLIK